RKGWRRSAWRRSRRVTCWTRSTPERRWPARGAWPPWGNCDRTRAWCSGTRAEPRRCSPSKICWSSVMDAEKATWRTKVGHAQMLEALGVDYVDESEVLTPADEEFHINKHLFRVPFVCGCRDLGEALRRIGEGAAMIRTKGEAGTGNVVEAVRHMRSVQRGLRRIQAMREDELMTEAKRHQAPYELIVQIHETGKLPVPNFSAGGRGTPGEA